MTSKVAIRRHFDTPLPNTHNDLEAFRELKLEILVFFLERVVTV